jgi:MFS transporter, ceroid-lipofuscinosis neuronal protein 7
MSQQSTQTPGGESRGTTKNGVGTTNNPMHYEPETFATSNQDLSHSNQGKEKTSRRLSGSKKSNSRRRLVLDFFNELDGSLVIVGVIVFVGDTSRGVLFPVLSTLNTALNGTTIDLGYLVAMFSIGRLVVTAPLGYVSDKYRHKLPLLLSSLLLVVGAVLWGNAYAFSKLPLLYLAQFLLGVGSGSLGVTRSFVVEQCEPKKRTEALAIITALQYAGFTVSPILGSWLVTIGDNSSPYWSFALPAYFIAAMAAMCLIALLVKFQDIPAAPVEFSLSEEEACLPAELSPDSDLSLDDATKRDNVEAGNARIRTDDDPAPVEPSAESAAEVKEESSKLNHGIFGVILGMFLLNISTKGSISVYETLGAQIGLVDYGMSTVALGALISGSGAMGFCQLLLFTPVWTKYFTGLFSPTVCSVL